MGVTLNGKMILKTDIIPSNQDQYVEITTLCYSQKGPGFIGVTSFTSFDLWNVYACSQPEESGIYSIVNMFHSKEEEGLDTLWINLREEPSMYISLKQLSLLDI